MCWKVDLFLSTGKRVRFISDWSDWPLGVPLIFRPMAKTDPVSETSLLFYRSNESCKNAPNGFNCIRVEFMLFFKFHTYTKHLQVYCCICLDPPQIRTNISWNEGASWELILYVSLLRIEFLFVSFVSSSQWNLFMLRGLFPFSSHFVFLFVCVFSILSWKSLNVHFF